MKKVSPLASPMTRSAARIATLVVVVSVIGWTAACSFQRPQPSPIPTETSASTQATSPVSPDSISGAVIDVEGNPIAGAIVRIKTTGRSCITGDDGHFTLSNLSPEKAVVLTAWAAGYYIGGGEKAYSPGTANVVLTLTAHASSDHPEYQWLSAFSGAGYSGSGEDGNCQNCHADPENQDANLPFPEWQRDAHALSAQNTRFLSMYLGTDLQGNQSPETRYFSNRDYGRIPLRPDLSQPFFGPGYKLDFPDTAGNCAACHVPAAAIDAPYSVDPVSVDGVGKEGVTCDFCHKVWDARLDPLTGLPYANMPGVLSFEFRRPPQGHQFFAGPYDDVAPGEDTYTPIQRESQFCAACHYGIFWDTLVYNSFGEWLDSPYSDPARAQAAGLASAKTCQDCHMPAGKSHLIAAPEKGGLPRDPDTVFSHRMPGAADETLLQNSVTLTADARREGATLVVEVSIFNDQAGHHVPTDSPLRQMILLVKAVDDRGQALEFQDGPSVPAWGGVGDPGHGYYAGLPGKGYAKILEELWTEISPSGAYWNPTRLLSDNRIPALGADNSVFIFTPPESGEATIEIILFFRRAFKELMDQKGWDVPDIVMERQIIRIP